MKSGFSCSCKVLSLATFLGAPAIFADSTPSLRDMKPYTIGFDLTYSHHNAKFNSDKGVNHFDVLQQTDQAIPGINLGVAKVLNEGFYVGGVGDLIFGFNKTEHFNVLNGHDVASKVNGFAYGLRVKAGYFIDRCNLAVYGLGGMRWKQVKFIGSSGGSLFIRKPFWLVGAGFERPISNNTAISFEYEFVKKSCNRDIGFAGITWDVDSKYIENTFKLGVKYHL